MAKRDLTQALTTASSSRILAWLAKISPTRKAATATALIIVTVGNGRSRFGRGLTRGALDFGTGRSRSRPANASARAQTARTGVARCWAWAQGRIAYCLAGAIFAGAIRPGIGAAEARVGTRCALVVAGTVIDRRPIGRGAGAVIATFA